MKIEKINDKQIKVFLDQNDLEERDLNISELAYGGEKAQNFFREMIEVANEQFGFKLETNHIAIEAIPLSIDSIVLVLTQLSDNIDEMSEKLSLLKGLKELFKSAEDYEQTPDNDTKENTTDESVYVYKFKNLDTISELAYKTADSYNGSSILFKYKNMYYLQLVPENKLPAYIAFALSEYGEKCDSSYLSDAFFSEHGEVIIKDNALKILSSM